MKERPGYRQTSAEPGACAEPKEGGMAPTQRTQRLRQREDDMEIQNGNQSLATLLDPLCLLEALTRDSSDRDRNCRKVAEAAVLTRSDVSTQHRSAAERPAAAQRRAQHRRVLHFLLDRRNGRCRGTDATSDTVATAMPSRRQDGRSTARCIAAPPAPPSLPPPSTPPP